MRVGDRVRLKNTNSWESDVVTGIITEIDRWACYLSHNVKLAGKLDGIHHNWYSKRELELLESEE